MELGKGCEKPVSQITPKLFTGLAGEKVVNKILFSFMCGEFNFLLVP
jgi:hypothetical protein